MEFRSMSDGKLFEKIGSDSIKSTFLNDGLKAWNLAPASITDCKTFILAKTQIKKFANTLPF